MCYEKMEQDNLVQRWPFTGSVTLGKIIIPLVLASVSPVVKC